VSYDLFLFPAGIGDDLAAAYERLEVDAGPPDPVKEERKQLIATKLQALFPVLVVTERDFAAIAAEEGISEQDARWENREVELLAPGGAGQTVGVDLFDDQACVRVEFPKRIGDEQTLSLVWALARCLVTERGFVPYDPQLGRAVDLENDFEAALACFRSFVDQEDGLARAAAAELADVWESYWPARAMLWEEAVEQHPRVGEQGRAILRLVLTIMNASELDDAVMAQALGTAMMLADDHLLIDWATFSKSEFAMLPWQLINRDVAEHFVTRTGIADWCSRLGEPLLSSDGESLGFGVGPLPGSVRAEDLQALVLTYSAPGSEGAAPDARHDMDTAFSEALPTAREVLAALERRDGLPLELRQAAETHGRILIQDLRIASQPLLRAVALRGSAREVHELQTKVQLGVHVANCLVLVGAAETQEELDEILLFDNEILETLE
jgi:hypothetical protein